MNNCTAMVFEGQDTLDAGRRVAGAEVERLIYNGPANVSSPSSAWQQAAALEGLMAGTLHIHTREDLTRATRALVWQDDQEREYAVSAASVSGIGHQWRLPLQRRP